MKFLIDASLPRRASACAKANGHEAVDVRDIGMGTADDSVIADHAREQGLCLLTRDYDFADIRDYPPEQYHGLVVFDLPDDATADVIVRLLELFLRQQEILDRLPGRLAIVEFGRVRLRPAD